MTAQSASRTRLAVKQSSLLCVAALVKEGVVFEAEDTETFMSSG